MKKSQVRAPSLFLVDEYKKKMNIESILTPKVMKQEHILKVNQLINSVDKINKYYQRNESEFQKC